MKYKKLPLEYIQKGENVKNNFFVFKQDIGLSYAIRIDTIWEQHLYDKLNELKIKLDGTNIIDIGANLGVHTLPFAELAGDKGKVYAFEPQRIVYYQLCANTIANGYDNVYAYNVALGNNNGKTHIENQNFFSERMLNIGDTHISEKGDEVELRTLDSYNFENVSLIKMDAQGYEPFILEGALETIKKNQPVILIEILEDQLNMFNKSTDDIIKFFKEIGYKLSRIKDIDYVAIPREKEIQHIYQDIDGWFDFESTYKEMVDNAVDGAHFVEVGAWMGKSTSYMAVEIAKSGKKIEFDAVDTWEGSPNEESHQRLIQELGMSLYDKFLDNMKPVIKYVTPIKGYSTEVAEGYEDNSLDFVFLDASHDYDNVKADIEAWYPKVKCGGIIAGHDYNEAGTEGVEWTGVVKAVNEFFGVENITVRKVHAGTWVVKKFDHYYKTVPGWFDFEDVYSEMVNRFDNALFVELGAAYGKSSAYMAVEIGKSKKNMRFDVVDKWEDENGSFYEIYEKNIQPVKKYINTVKGYTTDVVNQYEDNSIDFLFIDASHTYEDVLKDIQLWYHKVKPNGVIAGHDYNWGDFPGVPQAVNEYFGEKNIRIVKWSWIYEKKIENAPEHGRGGFLPAINYIKEKGIKNPVIVEIGTQRNFDNTGDGCSTTFFSWFVNTYGGRLYSIDIEDSYIENGKIELRNRGLLTNRVNLICKDGIQFFDNFEERIDLLYLDAWDYRGTDEDKKKSEESHLECFLKAEPLLSDNAVVLIDDIADVDTYIGKGHLIIPYLFKKNYNILLKEWQFLFAKPIESTIKYMAGGLLGDFINQLSIIKENYILTGKKGDIYLVDNNNVPDSFPGDWRSKPCFQIDWRFGIEKAYNDLKDVVLAQDYISSFQIYNGEKYDFIHLSSWRKSPLLYRTNFYEIFRNEYNVEWGKHKWLDLQVDDTYKDTILVSSSIRRFNSHYDYKELNKYNKRILFVTTDVEEYNKFQELTNTNFEFKVFGNLIDYWTAINSCYLFVTNLSSFSSVSTAVHANTLYLLPEGEDGTHFKDGRIKWYLNYSENNISNKILVMSCCYNEEHILPFYLDYYTNFIGVNKIVIYDGGSTDRSQEIIKQCPIAELIIEPQEKLDDRYLNDTRNNGWKKWRDEYDWIIVCDMDEFIYHPNLKQKLMDYDKEGITIPLTEGFDMIDKKFPKFESGNFITNIIQRGVVDNVFLNKKSIFKSSIDINYHIGSHGCDPTGPVKYSSNIEIKHLHYKWLGNKYLKRRSAGVADRLSDWNLSGGCGAHNRPFSLTTMSDYNKRCDFQSVQVLGEEKGHIPLYAFSHNYLINNWEFILDNQLKLLKESGLYEELTILFMYAYGDDKEFNRFNNKINSFDDLFRVSVVRIEENFYEYPTLNAMEEFVKYENAYILYFHLKGVWSTYSSGGNRASIDAWRKCLEYFNIEKWRDCVRKLDEGYEVVGALYNYNPTEPLFSGNFWWTTSKYVKKLPKLEYIAENDPHKDEPNYDMGWCRVECEKWINKIPNKFYNFWNPKDFGFYFIPIEEYEYRKDNLEKYKISVLIPTYKRNEALKEAIDSVVKQGYNNIEILVCHDGPSDEYLKFKIENNHYRDVKFYWLENNYNNYGAAQRNMMLKFATGDFILHLDDDNILYDNYLKIMTSHLDDETGMVVCRIHFNDKEWINYVLPIEDKLKPCFIDQLGILFKADVAKMFMWDSYFGHDHRYITACENVINERGLKIKYLPDVLASHRFLGKVIPRIVVVHHCYLRYNWKKILEEQIFLMKRYGLYEAATEIHATMYADDEDNYGEFLKIIDREDTLKKWNVYKLEKNDNEFEALKFIKKYSENLHTYICYFHLKGVISEQIEPNVGIPTWRKYLNYFTINKWKENVEALKDNDVVCVDWNFNDMHQRYVLGGHFFWTKSEYIRTLSEPVSDENRFLSEIWITSNPNVKVHENFNYEKIGYKNLYLQYFDPSLYRNDTENIQIEKEFRGEVEKPNPVYVITSHPNYKMSEDITKKTVYNLKLMGEKVILSAHCPTDRNIQGLVDYFIYDKNNPLIKHDFFTQSWFPHDDYYAHLNITKFDNNLNHALGVFLNYYNSLILAKQQGFNIAVCTNFDMIFSAEDKKIIDTKIEEMVRTGKKAFFMNTPEREGTHYKTIFFITNIDYFLNTFEYLYNEQVYMKEMARVGSNTNCLENFFYHTLKDKTNDLLLQEINEDKLFPTSQINLFSLIEYNTILSVENEPDCFVVWFSSANSLDSREMNITIRKNGTTLLSESMTIDKKFIYFKKVRFTPGDVFDINFRVTNLGEVLKNKTITVNDEVFADIQSYGKFVDKKGIDTL